MPRLNLSLALLLLSALACSGPGSSSTPDSSALETQIAERVAATLAAAPTSAGPAAPPTQAQPVSLPTPVAPTAAPTPAPTSRPIPTAFTPAASDLNPNPAPVFALQTELPFGDYVVRYWHDTSPAASAFGDVVVIAASGEPPIQIENVVRLGDETGMDVNGDGLPEVVVETYSGGAHCCSTTIVYTMSGNSIREILHSVESNCGGRLIDLDGDGILEFDTCDDSFAYIYCPYATSPVVRVIFAYDPALGYVPASPKFASLYADQIAQDTQRAQAAKPGDSGEWDNTTKCSVLPMVLDYFYTGQTDKAWSELKRVYAFPDAATWQADIEKTVLASPRYAAP